MHQLASKVKVSRKVFTPIAIAVVGILVLGGLGYRLYGQQQTLGNLQKQIQSLPSTVPPEKRVELEKDRITLENTLFGTLVQTVGGLLLFTTAYVSYQNLKATQKNVVVAEEKQVTERFTQAINQLGSEKIEVRLGGIYALERIAKDSPKDHRTIMEVLTAFVRERSPVSRLQKSNRKQTFLTDFLPSEPSQDTSPKIATDLQAALTVIGRRDPKKEEPLQRIDLRQTDLSGADLSRAHLINANISGADLSGADLSGADFVGANLSRADLSRADLSGACLIDANLSRAYLINASLSGADLSRAYLINANLSDANLSRAYLINANLVGADLSGADLSGVNLSRADLSGAYLINANLSDANLSGANLSGADLIDANLSGANLSRANLISADLSGANLSGIQNWTEAQLALAKLSKTIVPEGCNLNPKRDCEALGISLDPPATDSPD